MYINIHIYTYMHIHLYITMPCGSRQLHERRFAGVYIHIFFDGYCSTVQGLLDWFEVDLGFT